MRAGHGITPTGSDEDERTKESISSLRQKEANLLHLAVLVRSDVWSTSGHCRLPDASKNEAENTDLRLIPNGLDTTYR